MPVLFASTMFGKYGSYVTIGDIPRPQRAFRRCALGLQSWEAPDPAGGAPRVTPWSTWTSGVGSSEGKRLLFRLPGTATTTTTSSSSWAPSPGATAKVAWRATPGWQSLSGMSPPRIRLIWRPLPPGKATRICIGTNICAAAFELLYARPLYVLRSEPDGKIFQAMMRKYPLMNDYWRDKEAQFEKSRFRPMWWPATPVSCTPAAASRASAKMGSTDRVAAHSQHPGMGRPLQRGTVRICAASLTIT